MNIIYFYYYLTVSNKQLETNICSKNEKPLEKGHYLLDKSFKRYDVGRIFHRLSLHDVIVKEDLYIINAS